MIHHEMFEHLNQCDVGEACGSVVEGFEIHRFDCFRQLLFEFSVNINVFVVAKGVLFELLVECLEQLP